MVEHAQAAYEALIRDWQTTASDAAWAELWRRLERLLQTTVRGSGIKGDDLVHDACIEIFTKILNNLGQYNPRSAKFSTWVVNVAKNALIDRYRKRGEQQLDDALLPYLVLGNHKNAAPGVLTEEDLQFIHGYVPFRISKETLHALADVFFAHGGAVPRAALDSAAEIMNADKVAWSSHGSISDVVQALWMLIRMAKFTEADWDRCESALSRYIGFGPLSILKNAIGRKQTAWLMLAVGGTALNIQAPGVFAALLPKRRSRRSQ